MPNLSKPNALVCNANSSTREPDEPVDCHRGFRRGRSGSGRKVLFHATQCMDKLSTCLGGTFQAINDCEVAYAVA